MQAWRGLLDPGPELRDFADTAALMASLDLIISVDTSIVHMAGALGNRISTMIVPIPTNVAVAPNGEVYVVVLILFEIGCCETLAPSTRSGCRRDAATMSST